MSEQNFLDNSNAELIEVQPFQHFLVILKTLDPEGFVSGLIAAEALKVCYRTKFMTPINTNGFIGNEQCVN